MEKGLNPVEGTPVLFDDAIWIIKGYQHPPGRIIAYPRYDPINRRRLQSWMIKGLVHEWLDYWDCIGSSVPQIPLNKSIRYASTTIRDQRLLELLKILRDYHGEDGVWITGSSLVMHGRDMDLVINDPGGAETIVELRRKKVLRPPGPGVLFMEWGMKHRGIPFNKYLELKSHTVLQGLYHERPYSIRISLHPRGVNECVDRVLDARTITGRLRITGEISKFTTPSLYRAVFMGENVILETHRMLYAELEPGPYKIMRGRLEHRMNGKYVVPDHGLLIPER